MKRSKLGLISMAAASLMALTMANGPVQAGPADETAPVGAGVSPYRDIRQRPGLYHRNFRRHHRHHYSYRMRHHRFGGISRAQSAAKHRTDVNNN